MQPSTHANSLALHTRVALVVLHSTEVSAIPKFAAILELVACAPLGPKVASLLAIYNSPPARERVYAGGYLRKAYALYGLARNCRWSADTYHPHLSLDKNKSKLLYLKQLNPYKKKKALRAAKTNNKNKRNKQSLGVAFVSARSSSAGTTVFASCQVYVAVPGGVHALLGRPRHDRRCGPSHRVHGRSALSFKHNSQNKGQLRVRYLLLPLPSGRGKRMRAWMLTAVSLETFRLFATTLLDSYC